MSQSADTLATLINLSLRLHHLNKKAERKAGMTIVQWCVLRHMSRRPASSASSLSDALRIHPSTLSQTLKRLIRKEHIFVAQDPRDSRKKLISVTRKGIEALDHSQKEMVQLEHRLNGINRAIQDVETYLLSFKWD